MKMVTVGTTSLEMAVEQTGPDDGEPIVLLHGFPSSSRMYETLMPLLATRYHLIAPDYPGFGQSDALPPSQYNYTFDHLAETTNALLEQLKISRYSLYLQDYGAPVGYRIMLAHPGRVQALVIQNGNAYEEGLGAKWKGIAQYWVDPKAHPEVPAVFSSLAAARLRHDGGSPNPERYNPEAWIEEYAFLSRPGEPEIQESLLYDYRTNVASCRRRWWSGGAMTVHSSRPAPKPISATSPTPKSTSSTQVISRSTKVDEIAALMLDFLPKHVDSASRLA